MDAQLEQVRKSYDKGIDSGKKGISLYDDLPEHITNDPDYPIFQQLEMEGLLGGSARKEIRNYLSPDTYMKFIDLGCCVNLMFRGYDTWPSTYHGVDISPKTIQLLNAFAASEGLPVGALYCGGIHDTPFDTDYFDIGACIGVLEYFEKEYAVQAVLEAHRIIKPSGKFVLEIPNLNSPSRRIMALVEAHLGRPNKFDLTPEAFEPILQNYFTIEKAEKIEADTLIQYFLICKK